MLVCYASAQQQIDEIRQRYKDVKERIAHMGTGADWMNEPVGEDGQGKWPPEFFHVRIVQNLPGTGYHEENVRMYYEEDGEEGEVYPPLRLSFASSKYNFAAREFYEEYLYDTGGNLVFIYAQSPDVDYGKICEFRFYFRGGEVIEAIIKKRGFNEDFPRHEYSGSDVPKEYKEYLDGYLNGAKKIEKMFEAINNGRNL